MCKIFEFNLAIATASMIKWSLRWWGNSWTEASAKLAWKISYWLFFPSLKITLRYWHASWRRACEILDSPEDDMGQRNLKRFKICLSCYLSDEMGRGVGGGEKNCQQVQVSCGGPCQKHLKRRSELKTKRAWIEYIEDQKEKEIRNIRKKKETWTRIWRSKDLVIFVYLWSIKNPPRNKGKGGKGGIVGEEKSGIIKEWILK